MSVQTQISRITAAVGAAYDAVKAKGGTTPQAETVAGLADAIGTIPTGGSDPGAPGDITFYDYDGTIVTSWTLAELATKTALPDYPSHEGLTCQGWNWSLADLKTANRKMNVGAMYITNDGATRLHIRIATVGRMTVPLYIWQNKANGVSIDWGDGSSAETLSGTGNVNTSHTYTEPGDYIISLMPQDGCTLSFGDGSTSNCVMGSTGNNGRVYCNMLQEVYVGKNVTTIGSYVFKNCYSLASVTIPDGVTSINNYAFYNCYSLESVTIPDGVTSINNNAFYSCYSLASVTIPDGVTSIGNYTFYNCYSLASVTIPSGFASISNSIFYNCYSLAIVTIPDGVTSINNNAFGSCYGMRYYDFSACTSVPALSNTNAFNNLPSDCQMLIPAALADAWKAATNWSTYADHIVGV